MPSTQSLKGTIQKVVFSNPENGFAVCRFLPQGTDSAHVIAGLMLGVSPGELLDIEGHWETGRHGRQFTVDNWRPILPTTLQGIEKYLGSGLIPGVGKKMAERIVRAFGEKTLQVLDEDPSRLEKVKGLGKKRAGSVASAWQAKKNERDLSVFLQSAGLSRKLAPKIIRRFGPEANRIVREKPYDLAMEITGIGFETADKIAASLGVSRDSPERAQAGAMHILTELCREGHSACPRPLLVRRCTDLMKIKADAVEAAIGELSSRGLVTLVEKSPTRDEYVFLRPLFDAESQIAAALATLRDAGSRLRDFDEEKALKWLASQHNISLSPGQGLAVTSALKEKIMVITGGPGTGKTTIVHALCLLTEALRGEILLAAPTGRAAKRLSETTGRQAKTLHRLLEIRPGGEMNRQSPRLLDPDILLIDEASMIDLPMMWAVTRSISPKTHLVLVGDAEQLPSVGPGAVLRDIIECKRFPVHRLRDIFRQEQSSLIVINAHRILQGQPLILPKGREKAEFYFIRRNTPARTLETIIEIVTRRIPRSFGLDPMSDVQVISPMHKGETGVTSLNQHLQEALNPDGVSLQLGRRLFRVGDRVLQTANDYDREVFNGDLGRILHVDLPHRRLIVDFDGRRVVVEGARLDDLNTAYAISIHKSQGSEYPAVVLPLSTQHFIMLQRNLLYTAVTRAKKLVILVGSERALDMAIENNRMVRRYGLLRERLAGGMRDSPSDSAT